MFWNWKKMRRKDHIYSKSYLCNHNPARFLINELIFVCWWKRSEEFQLLKPDLYLSGNSVAELRNVPDISDIFDMSVENQQDGVLENQEKLAKPIHF